MAEGLVPPCLELGDSPEHGLLEWAGRNTGRRGLVLIGQDKVSYRAARDVPGVGEETFQHLEDDGWIEKVRIGESHRYRVLVFCSCQRRQSPEALAAGDCSPSLRLRRRGEPIRLRLGSAVGLSSYDAGLGVKSESVQKRLARDYFPQVLDQAGVKLIMEQSNVPALARNLKLWQVQHGIDISMARQMMDEFGRHPEWCQSSNKPPWLVFVGRRDKLVALVAAQRRRDPANREWSGNNGEASYWNRRPTSRINSAV